MNILGLGNDIIEIERIQEAVQHFDERFLRRILTEKERAYCQKHKNPIPHIAGRFSIKESIAKALGTGIGYKLGWHDMEILNDEKGKPYVTFSVQANHLFQHPHVLISLSHCEHYVASTALWIQTAPL